MSTAAGGGTSLILDGITQRYGTALAVDKP